MTLMITTNSSGSELLTQSHQRSRRRLSVDSPAVAPAAATIYADHDFPKHNECLIISIINM